jgi:hypothetical protein
MRKVLLGLVLVACVASVANAQLNLFYDVRSTTAAIITPAPPYTASTSLCHYIGYGIGQNYPLYQNGGRGDGQVIYLSPKLEDVTDYTGLGPPDGIPEHEYSWDPNVDWSRGDFYLYAEYFGAAGTVISSIGVTQSIPGAFAGGSGMYLQSVATTVQTASLWDNTNFTGSNASTKLKMVRVPVLAGSPNPVFNPNIGLRPNGFEKIAKVHVETAYRNGESAVKSWGVKLALNELLCTAVKAPPGSVALNVNFGYATGSPEAGGSGSQLTPPLPNPTDDMKIMVVRKGDFDFDGVPCTGSDDFAYFDIALLYNGSNCDPPEQYLADWDTDGVPATGTDDGEYFKQAMVP